MGAPANGNVERKARILVVEDEFFIAMELDDILTRGGYLVVGPASSVDHALKLIGKEVPDAAVLDVNLGKEKVTPVALQLKALGVPFILTMASDAAELARHPILAGANNIGKPTDPERLVQAVKTMIS